MPLLDHLFGSAKPVGPIMQVLDAERAHYVSVYLRGISDAKAQHELAVPEVKVELSSEKLSKPYRYYTLDIFYREGDKSGPIEVNINSAKPFKPLTESWQGLEVTLHPFVWNGLEFRIDGDLSDDTRLITWMTKWLDVEDKMVKDDNLLSGIIHNVTPPEKGGIGWSFAVDFGSAPIESFVELVEVIRSTGAKRIELGSFGYKTG